MSRSSGSKLGSEGINIIELLSNFRMKFAELPSPNRRLSEQRQEQQKGPQNKKRATFRNAKGTMQLPWSTLSSEAAPLLSSAESLSFALREAQPLCPQV